MGSPSLGVPGGIRTPDLLVRSQTLYPAELQAQNAVFLIGDSYIVLNCTCSVKFYFTANP